MSARTSTLKSGLKRTGLSFKILFLSCATAFLSLFEFPKLALSQDFEVERRRMVDLDLQGRDITDPRVLAAMLQVPRHEFVPQTFQSQAYADHPLPIGAHQTISQPYIVALMTQTVRVQPGDRVLEVGTGSGYQAAVLGELARDVYSVEIIESLARESRERLARLGYDNVHVRHGDGYRGWKEHAPFDAIIITAAAPKIPQPLVDQLKVGGRMVLPVEGWLTQKLILLTKQENGLKEEVITAVRFVPMTGKVREKEAR